MDDLATAAFGLVALLIGLPFLAWLVFNRWRVWTRLLESQLDRLPRTVNDLKGQGRLSPAISHELRAYTEAIRRILAAQRRSAVLLTMDESRAMGTLLDITRGMRQTIRESRDPAADVSRYLETRRGTLASSLCRLGESFPDPPRRPHSLETEHRAADIRTEKDHESCRH